MAFLAKNVVVEMQADAAADLTSIRDTNLPDGVPIVYVTGTKTYWGLDKTSVIAANGTTVVNSFSSGGGVSPGRWILLINGGGGGGSQIISLLTVSGATTTALAGYPNPGRFTIAWVQSVRAWFIFDPTSVATGVSFQVVAPPAGTGRWMRQGYDCGTFSGDWVAQSAWFLDPISGNDDNDGNTSPTAIASWAELGRRINGQVINQATKVTQVTSVGSTTDVPNIDIMVGATGTLFIQGTATTTSSGTLTAQTALSRATNVPQDVTGSAGINAFLGQRILFTASGKSCWLVKDLGANKIRTTVPVTAFTLPGVALPAETTLVGNEGYSTQTFTSIPRGSIKIRCLSASGNVFNIDQCALSDSVGLKIILQGTTGNFGSITNCTMTGTCATFTQPIMLVSNCLVTASTTVTGRMWFLAGGTRGNGVVVGGTAAIAAALFDTDFLVQTGGIQANALSQITFGTCGIFDSGSDAYTGQAGSLPTIQTTVNAGANLLYGSGNTGVGIVMGSGASYFYVTKPIVTGGGGDTKIGSAAVTAYAAVPFVFNTVVNVDNLAQINVKF